MTKKYIITKKNNLFTYVTTNWGIVSTVELPENHVYKVLNKTLRRNIKGCLCRKRI